MRLSVKVSPSSSGQKSHGTVPFGLNIITIRCFREVSIDEDANVLRLEMNGNAAAPRPRVFRNCRRLFIPKSHFVPHEQRSAAREDSGAISILWLPLVLYSPSIHAHWNGKRFRLPDVSCCTGDL